MNDYLQKLAEIEKLIKKMDLPFYRKKVKNNEDLRWLKSSLCVKNTKHANYSKAMEIISSLV
jgi:hypothetical protein